MEEKIVDPVKEALVADGAIVDPKLEEPIKEGEETPKIETDPEVGKVDPLLDGYYKTNPFFYEVAEYFNIDPRDYDQAAPKLATIMDWIVEKFDVHKTEDILFKLRMAEDMVQRPGWDEKRYTNLFKYARLAAQDNSIKKAMSAFQRDPNAKW